jgi:hypothetical protein
MRTAAICPTCATYTNAVCVIYDGPYLSNLDIDPLTNLDEIIRIINEKVGTLQPALGFVPERLSNKSTNTSLGTSNTLYPTQNAVKVYVDAAIAAIPPAPIPTLQQVTSAGNNTSNAIILQNSVPNGGSITIDASPSSFPNTPQIIISDVLPSGVNELQIESSKLEWVSESGNGGTRIQFQYPGPNYYILDVPLSNGVLATSVNGVAADANGEITIPDPYRVYVAVISMVDGSIVNLIKNTLGTTLTWTASSGLIATLSTFLASESNTFVSVTSGSTVPKIVSAGVAVSSLNWSVTIYQTDNAGVPNNTDSVYVEIRVY